MNAPRCSFDDCTEEATCRARTVLGVKPFCTKHGHYVALIEQEWDDAEGEYLEQP